MNESDFDPEADPIDPAAVEGVVKMIKDLERIDGLLADLQRQFPTDRKPIESDDEVIAHLVEELDLICGLIDAALSDPDELEKDDPGASARKYLDDAAERLIEIAPHVVRFTKLESIANELRAIVKQANEFLD